MRTRFNDTRPGPGPSLALAALALALALPPVAALAGCGAADLPPPRPGKVSTCDPARLDACERAITQALSIGRASREAMDAYASARAAADPSDPWAKLWSDLAAPGKERDGQVIVIEEGPAAGIEKSLAAPHRAIRAAAPLPPPKAIPAEDLVLAMGQAAGASHIIHVRDTPAKVTELFPGDPLAPFMAGLRPMLRSDADAAHLNLDIEIASAVKRAIDAASAFDYVKAATETDSLAAMLERVDRSGSPHNLTEPVTRGRYALQLLAGAGLELDPESASQETSAEPAAVLEAPPPSAADTPYGDLLRVRTAKDSSAAWAIRSASILAAVAPDRRDALPSLFRKSTDCSVLRAPPMEGARDLVFAGRLAAALDKGLPTATTTATEGAQLPLPEWYRRYEILVRAVDETRSMWSNAPSLLYERGEVSGLSPSATTTYRRVTELAAKHIAAVQALEGVFPARYRALSHLGLVYSAGVLGDPRLTGGIIHLTQTTVQDKIARASDAKGVFEGALTGVFAGMTYPPAIQEAHYLALQGALTAKLKGDLLKRSGWGVAGLYASDALFRIITDQSKNLSFSSDQIARALAEPSIEMPSLAALATSFARYAALGVEGRLDPEQAKIERFPPERRAAREALKKAIAGLGEEGDSAGSLLEDVTELADGIIATVSLSFSERRGDKAAGSVVCTQKAAAAGPSPALRRGVARLSDVRRRILLHPRWKTGDGAWVRRVRLLVTLLSDAMDIAGKTGERPAFTIAQADAERALTDALRDWSERAAADALGGAYALARQGFAAKGADAFIKQNGQNLRRVLGGIALFFKDDEAAGKPRAGVALLDALAAIPLATSGDGDLMSFLLGYAEAFYARKQLDQGDLWLLSTLVLSGLTESPPPDQVLNLAAKQSSRLEWALRLIADVNRSKKGAIPDPTTYEAGMRKASDDACSVANAGDVLTVMGAIRSFASGDRKKARADLDRALEGMEARGLSVPKMTYKYEEKTASKIFSVTLGVSYGAGLLDGAHSFQLGIGVKSRGEPEGSMTATLSPPDAAQAGEEAARYYVHAAALAAAYHFIEGDAEHGAAAARRAIDALAFGVRLGSRSMTSADTVAWGADARALLAIDAQLAAEAGLPFLAGDLWTMTRGALAKDASDKDIADVLGHAPFGLAAVKDAAALRDRAAKSLKVLAAPLACTDEKVEIGAFEEASCEAYPLALSLRIGDALKKLPRLRPGGGGQRRCAVLKSLDAFLTAAEKGTYDPDAFTAAVNERRAEGDLYSAAILLTRQRRDAHCSPTLVAAARALAASDALGPGLRADLLGTAVNCSIAGVDAQVIEDLATIDVETQRLPDLTRNFRLLFSVTELAVTQGKEGALVKIATRPGFIDRWMRVSPGAATAALLIEHAARALAGASVPAPSPLEAERSQAAYALLCETFPPGERAATCATIKSLRPPFTPAIEARQKLAKDSLVKLLADASKPPPSAPSNP